MDRSGARFCVTDGSSGSRDHSFESTPHPAYGSELSTGGGRLVRALTAMEPARHPFPVSSTARTIGEQKAKVNRFHCSLLLLTEVRLRLNASLPVGASGRWYGAHDSLGFSWLRSLIAFFLRQSSGIYLDSRPGPS